MEVALRAAEIDLANFRFDTHWSAGLGVDNVLNRKYFLFHPFPQRTFVGSVKYAL